MSAEQALAFVLFAIVAAMTPGPSNIILASTGATVGVRRGLPCLLGVSAGMGFMMSVVAFGFGSLVLEHPLVLRGVKWCGVIFLLWLSWKIATSGRGHAAEHRQAISFWKAAAFQWVNPKSWLVSASAIAVYLDAGEGALAQSLAFGLLFLLAALPSCFVWLAFGASLQRYLRTDKAVRTFNIAMGTILAASLVFFVR